MEERRKEIKEMESKIKVKERMCGVNRKGIRAKIFILNMKILNFYSK